MITNPTVDTSVTPEEGVRLVREGVALLVRAAGRPDVSVLLARQGMINDKALEDDVWTAHQLLDGAIITAGMDDWMASKARRGEA